MKIVKLLATVVTIFSSVSSYSQQSYPINATGQTKCYNVEGIEIGAPKKGDPLYGQDANYLCGATIAFMDNGDGTVTDLNTGLMWQQAPPMEGMTWVQAKEYCENLEFGGYSDWRMPTLKELFSISNFEQGWPYLDTLYFKLSNGIVVKDEQYWADNKYVGETVEGRDDAAFGVNHVTGHIKAYPAGSKMRERGGEPGEGQRPEGERPEGRRPEGERPGGQRPEGERPEGERPGGQRPERERPEGQRPDGERGERPPMGEGADSLRRPPMGEGADSLRRPQMAHQAGEGSMPPPPQGGQGSRGGRPMGNPMAKQVRAVRGAIYGENNFVDNGNGTISDLSTGLMWAKDDNGEGIEWTNALLYAEGATVAGHSDWRLPNVKELQSIVDYSRAPSSKGVEAAIDPIFNITPFVNEAGDADYGYYWTSTSACFTKGRPFYFAWYVAFGRAVNNRGADFHGAGAVRFDSKSNNGIAVEGGEERYFNFVRLVRTIK